MSCRKSIGVAMVLPACAALVVAAASGMLFAQVPAPAAAGGSPAFAVASVKENRDPDGPRLFSAQPGGGVTIVNQTVRQLIYSAYQTQDYRVIGGPDWLATARFDITAKAGGDVPLPQRLLMVRTLLAERFGLVMRADVRELPVYAMTMARSDGRPGPGLRPSACLVVAANAPPSAASSAAGAVPCGNRSAPGVISSGGGSMDGLANQLGRLAVIGRPVVNRTGVVGAFDYELQFNPALGPVESAATANEVSIFTALQEQLGVTLRPATAPVDVLVIDRVSRPTAD